MKLKTWSPQILPDLAGCIFTPLPEVLPLQPWPEGIDFFFHDTHSLWRLKPLVPSWWNYLGNLRLCGLTTRRMLWQGQGAGFEVSKLSLFLWDLRYKFSALPATVAAVMGERES